MSCASSVSVEASPAVAERPRTLIVGLGNPILGDDGIGWRVAEALRELLKERHQEKQDIEIACFSLGGLSLMERLIGYDQAIIIDAVQTAGGLPGQTYDVCLADLPDFSAGHMTAAHDTSLQNALKLGRKLGASLPDEIHVIGIEAERVFDFSEALSPAVEAAVPRAVQLVMGQLSERRGKQEDKDE